VISTSEEKKRRLAKTIAFKDIQAVNLTGGRGGVTEDIIHEGYVCRGNKE